MAAVDAITLLIEDHRRVDALFDEYRDATDSATKERLVRTIISELSIHAAIEEQFLYPVVREVVSGGEELAEESLDEHQQVKDVLAALERLGVDDPEFEAQMNALIDDVRHHVGEEESELFPKLREAVSQEQLVQMGRALAAGKAMAPTRPHPELPNRPPANFVVGPVAGVADRVRDGLEAFADEGQWAELVRQGQQAVWDVVRTWSDAAQRAMPNVSASAAAQWRPDDVVERVFDFSNRLLSMQRKFAADLFGAVGGTTEEAWEQPSPPAEVPTPEEAAAASSPRGRPGAKKATAKKSAAKRSTAKRSTAKKSTAKKSTAKKSTAKKSTAKKSTAKKSTAGRATAPAAAAEELRDETVEQLQERARDADVEGRSQMSKDDLVDALSSEQGGGGEAPRDYASMSVVELREEAKRRDIKGRTGMNKAQLVRALQQEG